MKDLMKIGGIYFVAGVGSIVGMAVGFKISEKLLSKNTKEENKSVEESE